MLDFDFTELSQLDDVESHNVDRVLRSLHVPAKLRWKIIRRTSRDNARTPVQWDATANGGFSTGKPWLGVNKNYKDINLASQKDVPDSIYSWYKDMIALRKGSDVLQKGEFIPLETGPQVFAYRRRLQDKQLTIVLNFSNDPASCAHSGTLLKSNYPRHKFGGTLQPWEAVILG
jgi:glycosidase